MASRDGAKKWLRRAIRSGRVVPQTECSACGTHTYPRAHAYQPVVEKPHYIIWLCPEHSAQAANVEKGRRVESYSTKDLVVKLLKEAEHAERIRIQKVDVGVMSEEEASEDRKLWEDRVEAAQAAYRREMGFDDGVLEALEQEEEQTKSPFDLL